ncbi:hypothetical protein FRB95_007247 [Tulasnella sp. JGI-2019a]|nr:hypothetical protein FRB93_013691 [Tulasnella sp. JGI-2019a]KAG9039820.1 hypothetical protein FRB95_007247 [Tulasnella sp. JGI-2019a]
MASIADYRLIHASASTHPPSSLDSFTLHAPPVTDLWRKPAAPYVESDNAPSLITSTKLHAFRAAEVTVSATWTRLYDQAGLVLIAPASEDQKSSWVKTGIEFYNGKPNLSTVATPRASTSDWSLVPLSEHTVRIRVEREVHAEALSPSLWVYLMKENGERLAVREITWVGNPPGAMRVRPSICAHATDMDSAIAHSSLRVQQPIILVNSSLALIQRAPPRTQIDLETLRSWKLHSQSCMSRSAVTTFDQVSKVKLNMLHESALPGAGSLQLSSSSCVTQLFM